MNVHQRSGGTPLACISFSGVHYSLTMSSPSSFDHMLIKRTCQIWSVIVIHYPERHVNAPVARELECFRSTEHLVERTLSISGSDPGK